MAEFIPLSIDPGAIPEAWLTDLAKVLVSDPGKILDRAGPQGRLTLLGLLATCNSWLGCRYFLLNSEIDPGRLVSGTESAFLDSDRMGDLKRELERTKPRMAVIGGGHGTGWLAAAQRYFKYTLIQGPDDDGFGSVIFPLGVRIPAGDVINTLLQVANLSENDRRFLKELNGFTYRVVDARVDETIYSGKTVWNAWIGARSVLWERHSVLLEEVSARSGKRLENRGLADLIQGVVDWWLSSPLPYLVDLHRHDARETLIYGLMLRCSPYADRVADWRSSNGTPESLDADQEREMIAGFLAQPEYYEMAVGLLSRVLNISSENRHLMVQYAGRSLAGRYSDGRYFVGVQNAPRGCSTEGVHPEKLGIMFEDDNPSSAVPEALQALKECDLLVRSFGSLSTTTGQILLTPGVGEAIRSNRKALRVFMANNAPELLEGESIRLDSTLDRCTELFGLGPEEIARYALAPSREVLEGPATPTRIQQRPGESVPAHLVRIDDQKLAEMGVVPVRHEGVRPADPRPDISRSGPVAEKLAETYIVNQHIERILGCPLVSSESSKAHPFVGKPQEFDLTLNLPILLPKQQLHREISRSATELSCLMLSGRVDSNGNAVSSTEGERFRMTRAIKDATETQRLNPVVLRQACRSLEMALSVGCWSMRIVPLPEFWRKEFQESGVDAVRRGVAGESAATARERGTLSALLDLLNSPQSVAANVEDMVPRLGSALGFDGPGLWSDFCLNRDKLVVNERKENLIWLIGKVGHAGKNGKGMTEAELLALALELTVLFSGLCWEREVGMVFDQDPAPQSAYHRCLLRNSYSACWDLSEQIFMEDGHAILNFPLLKTVFFLIGRLLVLPIRLIKADVSRLLQAAVIGADPSSWSIFRLEFLPEFPDSWKGSFDRFLTLTGWFSLEDWRFHPQMIDPLDEFARLFAHHLPRGGDLYEFRPEIRALLLPPSDLEESPLRRFFINLLKDGFPE